MKWQTCDFYGIRNAEEILMISFIFLMSMIIHANIKFIFVQFTMVVLGKTLPHPER